MHSFIEAFVIAFLASVLTFMIGMLTGELLVRAVHSFVGQAGIFPAF